MGLQGDIVPLMAAAIVLPETAAGYSAVGARTAAGGGRLLGEGACRAPGGSNPVVSTIKYTV
jgi:hypothetical protein